MQYNQELLRQRLINYTSAYPQELEFRQQMLNFLQAHEDCFHRSCLEGHFTASAMLLNKEGTGALLMHHRKLDRWFQPGGHCDGDDDVLAVSLKEAREESGIASVEVLSPEIFDIDVHSIPANARDPEHLHLDIRFLLKVRGNEQLTVNQESRALRWFGPNELLPTRQPSVTRLFEKWKTRLQGAPENNKGSLS